MPDFDEEKKILDKKGTKLYLVIGLLILTIGGWLVYNKINTPELNASGCPVKGPYSEHVVLFDRTDTAKDRPIDELDARKYIQKFKNEVPQYSRLSFYIITDDPKETNIRPIKAVCNPGSVDQLGDLARLGITVTVKKHREEWENNFGKVINQVVDELMLKTTSPTSPIFEMINAVSINSFKHSNPKYTHKLMIFSDFMHHVDEYSFYDSSNIDIKKFINDPYFKKIYTSLRDRVDVELYCYKRIENGQCSLDIQRFWKDYFKEIDSSKFEFHIIDR